jgi:hypothetical protein
MKGFDFFLDDSALRSEKPGKRVEKLSMFLSFQKSGTTCVIYKHFNIHHER